MSIGHRLRNWQASPWFGWVGLLVGVLGVALALYFGLKPSAKRLPQLLQDDRTIVVFDPAVTKAFSLVPKEVLWPEDASPATPKKVFAAQFAVWNGGDLAIKPENVLKQLRVQMGSEEERPEAIWEVRTIAWSREEIQMRIGEVVEENDLPYVPIDFRILEKGDGALFQITYTGPQDLPLTLRGSVEGVRENVFPPARKANWLAMLNYAGLAFLVLFAIWRALADMRLRTPKKYKDFAFRVVPLSFAFAALLFLLASGGTDALTLPSPLPQFPYSPGP